jgi:hypothetical protein
VLVVIDLISIPNPNTGGHIAHLGGALLGFFYIRQLQLGNDLAAPFIKVINFFSKIFSRKKQAKMVVRKTAVPSPPLRQHKSNLHQHQAVNKQERVDAILDKISRSGYESLSKEEKDFLFKVSKEEE